MSLTCALGSTAFTGRKSVPLKNCVVLSKKTLLTECGTNIDQISVLFDGYTVESTERPEQKRRKKNFASVEMKADWNYSNSSELEKQQLTDLFAQKVLIDRIHVKHATGDADMLIVK